MPMIDVACPQCGRKFGWCGTFAQRPYCPSCRHRPPQTELDAVDAHMEADRVRRETDPLCASGAVLRQQRLDAGLGLRQAGKVMGMFPSDLSAVEQGNMACSEWMAERMREAYDVGRPT